MSEGAALQRSVLQAFRVMELIAELQPVGVSELARRASLPKSTVQRSLQTLAAAGYIYSVGRQRGNDTSPTRWSLSLRSFEVGSRAVEALNLRDLVLPEMEELLVTTNEGVHLNVLEGRGVVALERLEPMRAVRAHGERGVHRPAHAAATGKAILSVSSDDVVAAFLAEPLEPLTDRTITDPAEFRRELERVRDRGFAICEREANVDVAAIAVPLPVVDGSPLGALGISLPWHRSSHDELHRLGGLLIAARDRIAAKLHGPDGAAHAV
jgi:IclR family acetate operon transcriptional repressor